jgi:hypothetical protein
MDPAARHWHPMGPVEGAGPAAAAAAYPGISGHLGGQPRGSGERRPRQRSSLPLLSGGHAAGDECGVPDGDRDLAEHYLPPLRLLDTAPHLHRRARLAEDQEPNFLGYSIGKWIDENGDGRFDVLEIETRFVKGPHSYDGSGTPFHADDQASFKERLYLDRANPDILHADITSYDHALTRPWTITRNYQRDRNPIWFQNNCVDDNKHVQVGKEDYLLSADGLLMPVRKGQGPPDLRYFK